MMAKKMIMKTPDQEILIELNETSTADAVWVVLPFEAYVNVWGEEIYFEIPVKAKLENGRKTLEVGEVAFWPEGSALCLFFGRTPVSTGPEPVAISPVTPIGRIVSDVERLKEIGDRTLVRLDRV